MTRLFILLCIITGFILAGCSGDEEHTHAEGGDHGGGGAVTIWTDESELFMEYPGIVVGEEATFAVHLTRLSDFEPLSNSEVEFVLQSDEGAQASATETEARVPGIYGPDITFNEAGTYDMSIRIYGMVNDTIQVSGIPVYNSVKDIPATAPEKDPNFITFLKEQQWKIPFGTMEVGRRTLTNTIKVFGEIMPAQNATAVVSAPFAGTISSVSSNLIAVEGQSVTRGSPIIEMKPAVQSGSGPNFAEQYVNARSELQVAREKFERSKRLYEKEAIPEIELTQARSNYRQALVQFQTISEVVQLEGGGQNKYQFDLKAPISGTVIKSYVNPGMQVQAGQPLYEIANTSRIWLKAQVPISEQSRIANADDAAFSLQGDDSLYQVREFGGRLISRGNSANRQSRTIPFIYELNNPKSKLPLGLFTTVYIDTESRKETLAVPESALIEEEGNFVVFVQVSGESLEKRPVNIGIRDKGWVEITSGLTAGEHVVTKNAYQVKLASLSSEAPAHGHSH